MSFKPIPKKLLIHTVTYKPKKANNGGWGSGSSTKEQLIKYVRFKPKNEVMKTGVNDEKLIKGILYIDAKHSKPFIEPKVDSTIKFNGMDLTVLSCEPCFTTNYEPHHFEVILT
ncbi:putative minor capsid protein [Vagococcus penaei]|uniref:putative minor capsid protein n=1 Tax=Vagococcus penaei TaxID=633807 RepID=UPI00147457F6|nr:putative minor capsid protein [Vagococcus penaei]